VEWKAVSFNDAARKRIEEASAFEKRLRLEGLLNIPQKVGCFELRQITCKDLLEFEFAENRITNDQPLQLDDYVHIVWSLSKQRKFFKVWQIRSIARKIEQSEFLQNEILNFYYAAFNDVPSSSGGAVKSENNNNSSVYVCSIIDAIANSYGWSLNEIMNTPLSSILQMLQRSMKRQLGDKYAMRNGITQRARSNEFNKLNRHG